MLRQFASLSLATLVSVGCGRFGFTPEESNVEEPDEPDASVAPAPDAAVAQSSCETLSSLVCDGFETDLSAWTTNVTGGTLEIVSSPAFRGQASLRARTEAPGARARLFQDHAVRDSGTVYQRAYWYLPSSVPSSGLVELTSTGDDSGIHTHIGFDANEPILLVNNQQERGPPVARDTWLCIEVDLDIGPTGGARMRIDGVQVAEIQGVDTAVAGGYSQAAFGAYFTDDSIGAFEVYVDEVAVSDQPIGCD